MFSIPFELERSITINKPVADVYQHVGNFNFWRDWSPWIIQEPECPTSISGEPLELEHEQEWNGDRIGKGRIKLIDKAEEQSLSYDLLFLSPWKSQSYTQFHFASVNEGQGTEVRWTMQGTLPFFLFFMKKMMGAFVGGDYERGLKMLKELIETGKVSSKVDIKGTTEKPGFHYVGMPVECSTKEISQHAKPAMEKLHAAQLPKPLFVTTVINDCDLVKEHCSMVAAYAYEATPDFEIPTGFVCAYQGPHKALEVMHIGAYSHMANGWTTLMNYLRFKKLKGNKKFKEYEVYLNNPAETQECDLQTAIYAPIK